jgi:hypothetical protein
MARLVRIVGLTLCAGAISSPACASALGLSVSGNRLVDGSGEAIRLLGVSRSGSEYAGAEGFGFFDGPTRARSIRAAAWIHTLVDAVRSTGATQPLMLGGVDYARDLSGWLAHRPVDPLGRLVACEHNYGHHLPPCLRGCKAAIARVAASVPVVVGELGQSDHLLKPRRHARR